MQGLRPARDMFFSNYTRAAASANPPKAKKTGIKPTIVAVIPVRLAASITSTETGIATATIRIVPKITANTRPPTSILQITRHTRILIGMFIYIYILQNRNVYNAYSTKYLYWRSLNGLRTTIFKTICTKNT